MLIPQNIGIELNSFHLYLDILNNDICDALQSHFIKHAHRNTLRNATNDWPLCLASKLNMHGRNFITWGWRYNDLPIDVIIAEDTEDLKDKVESFLKAR